MKQEGIDIRISVNDRGNPPGKLAEAELQFTAGPLAGLKLIGFAIWERRNSGGRNVTFPARQYSVNGERRAFALLRPIVDSAAQDRIRDLILAAYDEHQEELTRADDGTTGQDRHNYTDTQDRKTYSTAARGLDF